jgi:hypothetical protein
MDLNINFMKIIYDYIYGYCKFRITTIDFTDMTIKSLTANSLREAYDKAFTKEAQFKGVDFPVCCELLEFNESDELMITHFDDEDNNEPAQITHLDPNKFEDPPWYWGDHGKPLMTKNERKAFRSFGQLDVFQLGYVPYYDVLKSFGKGETFSVIWSVSATDGCHSMANYIEML